MSIRTKGRRKISVREHTYIWYVALDDDSQMPNPQDAIGRRRQGDDSETPASGHDHHRLAYAAVCPFCIAVEQLLRRRILCTGHPDSMRPEAPWPDHRRGNHQPSGECRSAGRLLTIFDYLLIAYY